MPRNAARGSRSLTCLCCSDYSNKVSVLPPGIPRPRPPYSRNIRSMIPSRLSGPVALQFCFAFVMLVRAAAGAECLWIEAEHLDGVRGYCWPAQMTCRSAGRGPIRREFAHRESSVRMLRRWPVARHRATCRRSQIHGQRGRVDCGDMHSHRILRLHPSRAWVVAADTFAGFVFAGGSLGLTHIALASRRASVYLTSK